MMIQLRGSVIAESGGERRVFTAVCSAERENVVAKLRNGPVVLEVHGPIGVTVVRSQNHAWSGLDVHAIGAELEIVVRCTHLPRHAPVRRPPVNVIGKSCARVRFTTAEVLRLVKCANYVEMFIPHGVAAKTGNILTERAIDDGFRGG